MVFAKEMAFMPNVALKGNGLIWLAMYVRAMGLSLSAKVARSVGSAMEGDGCTLIELGFSPFSSAQFPSRCCLRNVRFVRCVKGAVGSVSTPH